MLDNAVTTSDQWLSRKVCALIAQVSPTIDSAMELSGEDTLEELGYDDRDLFDLTIFIEDAFGIGLPDVIAATDSVFKVIENVRERLAAPRCRLWETGSHHGTRQ